jgi:hypothetical protein
MFVLMEVTGNLGLSEQKCVLNARKDNQGVNFTGEDTTLQVISPKCRDISKQFCCCHKNIALLQKGEEINIYSEEC